MKLCMFTETHCIHLKKLDNSGAKRKGNYIRI